MKFNLYNLFKRNTKDKFIPELDGLRFLAILLVVLLHIQAHYLGKIDNNIPIAGFDKLVWKILDNGHVGVQLFFAISGFILALPFGKHYLLCEEKVSLKKYFMKRITRLEPPYIIALLSLFFLKIILGQFTFEEILPNLGASLFYIHNLIYNEMSIITPIAWSLEIEIQFYLLAPFLSLIFAINKKIRRYILISIILIMPFFQFFLELSKLTILGNLQYFVVGMLLCDLYLTQDRIGLSNTLYKLLGFFILPCLIYINSEDLCGKVTYPILVFSFYYIVLNTNYWKNVFSKRWVSAIGGMCYSIYLLHFAIISFLIKKTSTINFSTQYSINIFTQILLLLPLIGIICSIYFLLIEKPCMNKDWPQKLKVYFYNLFR